LVVYCLGSLFGCGKPGPTGPQGEPGVGIGIQGDPGTNGTNGTNGANGTNGYSSLTSLIAATVLQCPNGGVTILTGLDLDRDSNLSGLEVTSSATVCNGANGASGQAGTNGTNGANGGTISFSLVQAIMPCGSSSSPWKEVLLGLQGGQLLSSFSENANGLNTRFSFIPNGTYQDTDSSGCNFTVTGDGSTVSDIGWGAGSNGYGSWISGGYHWTQSTGWVGY
jgi:hypothetical protein